MKLGICQACGKPAPLITCEVCGAMVCAGCKLAYGCKLCRGRKTLK